MDLTRTAEDLTILSQYVDILILGYVPASHPSGTAKHPSPWLVSGM